MALPVLDKFEQAFVDAMERELAYVKMTPANNIKKEGHIDGLYNAQRVFLDVIEKFRPKKKAGR